MKSPFPKKNVPSRDGFALVVVLAAVVLLVGVALAFLSNALQQRQISESSASRIKTRLLADGAMNTIIGDLKQEIVLGSNATDVGTLPDGKKITIYPPIKPTDMVPATSGSTRMNGAENLVKISSNSDPFYSGAIKRASDLASDDDKNGNIPAISPARWNKPLFLPATSATDPSPLGSAGFKAPNWIYVSRDGSNPTVFNSDLKTSKTSDQAVVGRYAFAVYDEGGLLDVNAAGSPTATTTEAKKWKAQKGSPAYANLSALFELAGFGSTRATEIVDRLVTWRNEATLNAGGTTDLNFDNWAMFNSEGFLSTANTKLANGKSDRIFTSRQQLQKFLLKEVATEGEQDQMQKALVYLTTFSRALNQPSIIPASSSIVGGPKITADWDNGGNNAFTYDTDINPIFLKARVTSSFDRNEKDPTGENTYVQAKVGEPLITKRFALNRLVWLTFAGPITLDGSGFNPALPSDYVTKLKNDYGFTEDFLLQGTPENVHKYFGLSWVPLPSGSSKVWVYSHQGTSPLTVVPTSASGTPIKVLDSQNSTNTVLASEREPDFVELLKAAITVGSLAKGATDPTGKDYPGQADPIYNVSEKALAVNDTLVDAAVLKITANIMDQYDLDGYPTLIRFAPGIGPDGPLAVQEYRGVENLPYLYRLQLGNVIAAQPDPFPTVPTSEPGGKENTDPYGAGEGLKNPGVSVALLEPQIWNPHSQDSSMGDPRPQNFRIVVDSAPIDIDGNAKSPITGLTVAYNKMTYNTQNFGSNVASTVNPETASRPPFYNNYALDPITWTANTTELRFDVPNNALFREPTLLARAGVPSGSNLRIGDGNHLKTKAFGQPWSTYFPGDGVTAVNSVATPGESYVGIYMGMAPLRWVRKPSGAGATPQVYTAQRTQSGVSSESGEPNITTRLQFQDASGQWVTYDQKYSRVPTPTSFIFVYTSASQVDTGTSVGDNTRISSGEFTVSDPRTTRFGPVVGWRGGAEAWALDTGRLTLNTADMTISSIRPGTTVGASAGFLNSGGPNSFTSLPKVAGWYPQGGNTSKGKKTGNWIFGGGNFRAGTLSQNTPEIAGSSYYSDPDGVVRRAMGAYAIGGSAVGLPMAKNQIQSRPVVLNRPFRSVAELGYVFSDLPWRNLDMFTPESGFAPLLDTFCINDVGDASGMVAGKVNLNTRQAPVLQALISGAYRDDQNMEATMIPDDSADSLAGKIAEKLVERTISGATNEGPLRNLSELVGKWVSSTTAAGGGIDGSQSYSGFSGDLTDVLTDTNDKAIERFREASIRALASSGQTRVWNLMVDIVAQTGRFTPNADALEDFVVQGEQRYWVHLAIDRLTGQLIDKQVELVKE